MILAPTEGKTILKSSTASASCSIIQVEWLESPAENKAQAQLAAGAGGPLVSSEEPQAYTLKKEKAPKRQKLLRA